VVIFYILSALISHLELASEGFREVLGLTAKDRFVRVVFADLAVILLFDLDVGEGGIVE
jgi:hypothetical protein